jgi:hypothetical protein
MGRKSNSELKIEEILPSEYLTLSEQEKKIVCLASIKSMVDVMAVTFGKEYTTPDYFKGILQLTINQYEKNENYETCAILLDMFNMVDEFID